MTDRRGRGGGAESDPFAGLRGGGWSPGGPPGGDDRYEGDPPEPYWARQERAAGAADPWAPPPAPPVIPEVPVRPAVPPAVAGDAPQVAVPGTRRARRLAEAASREGGPVGLAVDERTRWDSRDPVGHTEDHVDARGDDGYGDLPDLGYDLRHDPRLGDAYDDAYETHDADDSFDSFDDGPVPHGSTRVTAAAPRRRGRKVLVFVLVLGLIGLGGYGALIGLRPVVDEVRSVFAPPADYAGPGTGEVTVTVPEGSSLRAIGDVLTEAGVVASSGAFVAAAEDAPGGAAIQAGTYTLLQNLPAADAVAAMLDGSSQVRDLLTVPEGQIAATTVAAVAEYRGVPTEEALAALQQVVLPPSAQGDPEGYLFPDSYEFGPDVTLVEIFQAMVDRGTEERARLAIPADVERDVVIKASIAEAEGRTEDFGNVVSVIDNRLAGEVPRTNGTLGMDSTCRYLRLRDGLPLGDCLGDAANPWNTRENPGLPPGPINSPGAEALAAAVNPPDTDFGYFVTVDLETRETLFTASYEEFLGLREQFQDWCDANGRPEGC